MASTKYKRNTRGYFEARVWDGTYLSTGAKHRKHITSKVSSADLEKKVNAFKRQLEEKETAEHNITLGEYSRRWFDLYKQTKEKNTQRMYSNTLHYLGIYDDVPLTSLRHSHLQQIININIDKPKTCKNIKQTYTQIIKSAVRDRYLPHSAIEELTADISLPKYIKPQKRALYEHEKVALKEADLDDKKRAFVTIIYYCGLRRGEALALTPEDFDWNKKTISISKTIIFDSNRPELKPYPKSDNGIRAVPLPEVCIPIIKPYVENCSGYLFKAQNNELMTQTGYKRMWESIISEMNIALGYNPNKKKDRGEKPIQGLTAHVFRHNYCTQLCYQIPTISTKMIARMMGDTEKVVLDVYSHILEEKENIQDALNNAF